MLLRTLIVISISFANCPQQKQTEDLIAKAYDNQLALADVDHLLDGNMQPSDSTIVIQKAIDSWLVDQIQFNEAKSKIKNTDHLESLVDNYRQSIYIHELEKLSLKEGIDTTITETEVDNYLKSNHGNYILEERIVRILLAKLPANYDNDQLENIWSTEDIAGLQALIKTSGGLGYTNINAWHSVDQIKELLPQELIDKVNFGGNKSYKEVNDKEVVFIKIIEDTKAGELAPRAYIARRIKQELLINRKKEFLNNWKKTLYQNNIQSKDIHIYN